MYRPTAEDPLPKWSYFSYEKQICADNELKQLTVLDYAAKKRENCSVIKDETKYQQKHYPQKK